MTKEHYAPNADIQLYSVAVQSRNVTLQGAPGVNYM